MSKHDNAIEKAKQTLKLDPLSLFYITGTNLIFYRARKYDIAIEQLLHNGGYHTVWEVDRTLANRPMVSFIGNYNPGEMMYSLLLQIETERVTKQEKE